MIHSGLESVGYETRLRPPSNIQYPEMIHPIIINSKKGKTINKICIVTGTFQKEFHRICISIGMMPHKMATIKTCANKTGIGGDIDRKPIARASKLVLVIGQQQRRMSIKP